MDNPTNAFKSAIAAGRTQIGLWCTLSSAYATEISASAGVDWLMIDMEHSPGGFETVLAQLQAAAAYPVSAVVRPAWNDPVLIKQVLDIGAQTILVPFVQSAEEARRAVAAARYPPRGIRGVSSLTRATRFGRIANLADHCERELCIVVQIESPTALDNIEEIASVDGVDGVFIGPNDLAAGMGLVGRSSHPDVAAAVEGALARLRAVGRAAGLLTTDEDFARRCLGLGACFIAVGVDIGILARGTSELRRRFDDPAPRHA